jgi:hypothetical protein
MQVRFLSVMGVWLLSPAPIEANVSATDWAGSMDRSCANCTVRRAEADIFAGIKLPHHAITSMFVGEFATALTLCVIDLDSGAVGCHTRKAPFGPVPVTPVVDSDKTGGLPSSLLDEMRTEAARLWQTPRHAYKMEQFLLFPGCSEDRAIVSGNRQLSYGEMGFKPDVDAGGHMRELVARAIAKVAD